MRGVPRVLSVLINEVHIGFVDDHRAFRRDRSDERLERVARDRGPGGVVGIADVNEARLPVDRRAHRRQIVPMLGVRRDPAHGQAEVRGKHRQLLVGGPRCDQFAVTVRRLGQEPRHLEELAGARADDDLGNRHALVRGELLRKRRHGFVRIARRYAGTRQNRLARRWRGTVGIFVAVEPDQA